MDEHEQFLTGFDKDRATTSTAVALAFATCIIASA